MSRTTFCANPHQKGHSDLNREPSRSERDALPIELYPNKLLGQGSNLDNEINSLASYL